MEKPTFKSTEEAAAAWGVTRATVNNWINRGQLPDAVKFGHKWRIPTDTVDRIAREGLELTQ
ncbi:excisionase family DNA binding protein [Modicisalibacter xianhensis]|uniref:Excisionase family DNA binding protein n=1 Tax=Modicisalibacter xianhensis TaxID=442341 RepID=A0A4V3GS60_9GAMM|nr:helix-turn-helix domain-containing protein [Halomonas xianhensis]TDX21603.1 excisionase family DNA binding protein [Halomonas xianhensis]